MAELKIGRRVFNINEKDVVLYNGACWLLTTQTYFDGWRSVHPTMSKSMCEKLVKRNVLVCIKIADEYVTAEGKQMGLYYYKFNMDKLEAFLDYKKEQ